jgi:hypothetical protein
MRGSKATISAWSSHKKVWPVINMWRDTTYSMHLRKYSDVVAVL